MKVLVIALGVLLTVIVAQVAVVLINQYMRLRNPKYGPLATGVVR